MGGKLVLDHEAWLEERLQNGDWNHEVWLKQEKRFQNGDHHSLDMDQKEHNNGYAWSLFGNDIASFLKDQQDWGRTEKIGTSIQSSSSMFTRTTPFSLDIRVETHDINILINVFVTMFFPQPT